MKIGFVGLGKMGGNMVKRLLKGDHVIVAFAPSRESREEAERSGAHTVGSLKELVERLESPRVVWLIDEKRDSDRFPNSTCLPHLVRS